MWNVLLAAQVAEEQQRDMLRAVGQARRVALVTPQPRRRHSIRGTIGHALIRVGTWLAYPAHTAQHRVGS